MRTQLIIEEKLIPENSVGKRSAEPGVDVGKLMSANGGIQHVGAVTMGRLCDAQQCLESCGSRRRGVC